MVTDRETRCVLLLAALANKSWSATLLAIEEAATFIREGLAGDAQNERIAATLAHLGDHSKWEVRRAVSEVAGTVPGRVFEAVLLRLATDENAQVRQSASRAMLRRRDWRSTQSLGKAHDERTNAQLADIEARYGVRGREAVKRVSEKLSDTFAREVYHELARLLSPAGVAADRLASSAADGLLEPAMIVKDVARISQQLAHMQSILNGMRLYSAMPQLAFASESISTLVEESVRIVQETGRVPPGLRIEIHSLDCEADVARSRLVQALTNLLTNAVESYDGLSTDYSPIHVTTTNVDGVVTIAIRDGGCGMSAEAQADAAKLFSTRKIGGSGVGVPLAIKIIQSEHLGALELASAEGVGTEVRVRVPARRVAF